MRVLIVEDEADNVELLLVRLKNLGCEALVATDPAAALRLAREGDPDLILLDLKLGNELYGGLALLEEFRAMPALARVPIVLHSVYVSLPQDLPAAAARADFLLPKPFRFQELARIVEATRSLRA